MTLHSRSKTTTRKNSQSKMLSWQTHIPIHSRHRHLRRHQKSSFDSAVKSFFKKYSSSTILKVCAVSLIIVTGILFGQGLFTANTLSGSAQQHEETVNARIITNFYTQNSSGSVQYHINELP